MANRVAYTIQEVETGQSVLNGYVRQSIKFKRTRTWSMFLGKFRRYRYVYRTYHFLFPDRRAVEGREVSKEEMEDFWDIKKRDFKKT